MDKRIGAQLYTVRDYTKTLEDFDKTLEKVAAIGYKSVQLSAIGPFSGEDIKALLDKHHLVVACTHRGYDEYTQRLKESIRFHKAIDCKIAGLGMFPKLGSDFTMEDVKEFTKQMNEVDAAFRENGMSFAYHNHWHEFMKAYDNRFIMEYFAEHASFDFILDVYWLSFAGVDPARYITHLGPRAKVIHFKDMKMVRIPDTDAHQMAEVMEGNLDWDSIIEAAEKAGSEWAMVEQDICQRDPFESLKISYDNLITKGFI